VRTDGTGEQAVSTDPGDEYWPSWSPDGSRLAYGRTTSVGPPPRSSYVTVDPDGSDEVMLAPQSLVVGPPTTWSPDGTMLLAFVSEEDSTGWGDSVALVDATRADPDPIATIDMASPWISGSWQRLAP
jgi:Tol biopolymer transport system component